MLSKSSLNVIRQANVDIISYIAFNSVNKEHLCPELDSNQHTLTGATTSK